VNIQNKRVDFLKTLYVLNVQLTIQFT